MILYFTVEPPPTPTPPKVSYKLISTLWVSKFPTRWYYHNWWAWLSILKVFKVTSLQNLYNVSKKEVRDGVHSLHVDKHQSFYKVALSFLMEVARYVQSTQNMTLVIFCNVLRKKCHNCFCVLFWCKILRYFTRFQSSLLLLVFIENILFSNAWLNKENWKFEICHIIFFNYWTIICVTNLVDSKYLSKSDFTNWNMKRYC